MVEAVRPYVSRQVWAMIELQCLTGARPGEVLIMRTADLNTSGEIWEYTPDRHKTEHHEHTRTIFIGPQAKVRAKAVAEDRPRRVPVQSGGGRGGAQRRKAEQRKSPRWPSHEQHQARKKAVRHRKARGNCYTPAAYRRAIARACDRAFPHPASSAIKKKDLTPDQRRELAAWRKAHRWHPHQLRHSAATRIRRRFGLEGAQAVLGHSELGSTQIYAEKNLDAARAIMQEVG